MKIVKAALLAGIAGLLGASGAQAGSFDGFYAGAEVGVGITSIKETDTATGSMVGSYRFEQDSNAATGVNGGIFAGYGKTFGRFYIGGEINGALSSGDYTSESKLGSTSSKLTMETRRQFGASIRPGVLVSESTLLYGRVGYTNLAVKSKSSDKSTPDIDHNVSGMTLGAGAEVFAAEKISVRLDYAHSWFGSTSATDSLGFKQEIKPQQDLIRVGVAYHF